MKINHVQSQAAISAWSQAGVSQKVMTQLITKAWFSSTDRSDIDIAIHRIEFDDGSVNHSAWRSNRINIFERWHKCKTDEMREKMTILAPAIFAAIRENNTNLYKQLTDRDSVEYRVTRLLEEHTDVVTAALNGAPLSDFERECDEAEREIAALRRVYRQQHMRHDQ